MRRVLSVAAGAALVTAGAWAQDGNPQAVKELLNKVQAEVKLVTARGAVMGPTVKNAPYSADEITESTQLLSDGTRIHNESQATVYRDSQGRVRRETPESISIFDPVEGVSYILNTKTQTGTKLQVSITQAMKMEPGGPGGSWHYSVSTSDAHAAAGDSMETAARMAKVAKSKGEEPPAGAGKNVSVIVNTDTVGYATYATTAPPDSTFHFETAAAAGPMIRKFEIGRGQSTALGKQVIEGVDSEGTRMTRTIETGSIGNDRPIQIVSERWYSPELQLTMMTKSSDPRSGEETFRLTNVRRGDPGAYLFQPPPGYSINDRK